jgi:hypothetical protein
VGLYDLRALREQTCAGVCFAPQMGFWSRLQQWLYARPRVAVAGSIVLLLLAGAAGWESSRLASPAATQVVVEPRGGVAGAQARMIQVEAAAGPVTRVVHRTRTITTPGATETVVRRGTRTRTVHATQTIREVVTVAATKTVARLVHASAAVTRPTRTVTVTRLQTETLSQTVTQPPVTVTVFVTTTHGHKP